mgnify:CR=1 FL=1|tara:strand:- start:165471 stop:165926 length:456 start_codon:yes stop_codon:yes gene_type:complete
MRAWRIPEVQFAVWGGLLNAIWEFAHSSLYTDHVRGLWYVVWTRLHCTGGDVMILVITFWVVSLLARSRRWATAERLWPKVLFVIGGFSYTLFSEWFNTAVRETWTYTESMPQLFGFGLSPLLQWTVVPPVVMWLMRRALCRQPTPKPTEA